MVNNEIGQRRHAPIRIGTNERPLNSFRRCFLTLFENLVSSRVISRIECSSFPPRTFRLESERSLFAYGYGTIETGLLHQDEPTKSSNVLASARMCHEWLKSKGADTAQNSSFATRARALGSAVISFLTAH